VILSRALAQRGHFPAIDVLDSVSRVATDVCDRDLLRARGTLVRLLAAHKEVEELLQIGAYAKGSSPEADVAIDLKDRIDGLLRQGVEEGSAFEESRSALLTLAAEAEARLARHGAGEGARV
jgi:flagellum-specific ATP synthase